MAQILQWYICTPCYHLWTLQVAEIACSFICWGWLQCFGTAGMYPNPKTHTHGVGGESISILAVTCCQEWLKCCCWHPRRTATLRGRFQTICFIFEVWLRMCWCRAVFPGQHMEAVNPLCCTHCPGRTGTSFLHTVFQVLDAWNSGLEPSYLTKMNIIAWKTLRQP